MRRREEQRPFYFGTDIPMPTADEVRRATRGAGWDHVDGWITAVLWATAMFGGTILFLI